MVIGEIIKELEEEIDRNETFIILEHILGKPKIKILTDLDYELTELEERKVREIIERRISKEPLQYITNEQFFFGNKFYVNENVLIPRADTEILVEEVLKLSKDSDKILDLCTGSGCIAISLKKANLKLDITASDISEKALIVAMINAKINNVKINFIKSDLFNEITQKFDIIVSNPPYIETSVINNLQDEVKKEPILALDGGEDGLDFYKKIISEAKERLNKKGLIALEIGYNQAEKVKELLLSSEFDDIQVIKDYGNNDRIVIARKK